MDTKAPEKPSIFDLKPGVATPAGDAGGNESGNSRAKTSPKTNGAINQGDAFGAGPAPDPGTGSASGPGTGTEEAPYGYKEDGTPRKKPGRKSGTGGGTSGPRRRTKAQKEIQSDLTGALSQILIGVHFMLAQNLKSQHWEMGQEEAQEIEKALLRVQDAYNVEVDPKTSSLIGLGAVLSMSYGPRIIAQAQMNKMKGQEPPERRPENPPQSPQKQETKGKPKEKRTFRPGDVPVDGVLTPAQMFGNMGGG